MAQRFHMLYLTTQLQTSTNNKQISYRRQQGPFYITGTKLTALCILTMYLREPQVHSQAGGHLFLSTQDMFLPKNGAVHNTEQFIIAAMSSAAEAELGTLFLNAKKAAPMLHMLIEMGHLQPPTPIQADNLMPFGIVTNKIIPKATKSMDMQFHWLCNHNAVFTGSWEKRFLQITGQNTMPPTATKVHDPFFSQCPQSKCSTTQNKGEMGKASGNRT